MTQLCVLHGDGDPQMREIVQLSLKLDPGISVISCATGADISTIATEVAPDLILCDVVMPDLDGTALLRRLQRSASTERIPVIMTAASDRPALLARMESLGAMAVIVKPFDHTKLARMIRGHLLRSRLAIINGSFSRRLRVDARALALFKNDLRYGEKSPTVLDELLSRVHKLAGAAGVFGFEGVSLMASTLEETLIETRAGRGIAGAVETDLDALLTCLEMSMPVSQKTSTLRESYK